MNPFQRFIWPVKILIIEKRGNGLIFKYSKAKRSKVAGDEMYIVKNAGRNIEIRAQEFKNIYINEKGKNFLMIYSPNGTDYFPAVIDDVKSDVNNLKKNMGFLPVDVDNIEADASYKPVKLSVRNVDLEQFRAYQTRKAIEMWRKQGALDRWLPIMSIVAAGSVLIFLILILINNLEQFASLSNSGMNVIIKGIQAQNEGITKLIEVLGEEGIKSKPVPTPIPY